MYYKFKILKSGSLKYIGITDHQGSKKSTLYLTKEELKQITLENVTNSSELEGV